MPRNRKRAHYLPATVLFVVVAGIALGAYAMLNTESLGSDGCRVSGAEESDVILMDASDGVEQTEIGQVAKLFRKLAEASNTNRKLWIFLLGGLGETDLILEFSGCSAANFNGALTGSIHRQKMQQQFNDPIEKFVAGLVASEKGNSPISEAADRLLWNDELFGVGETTLYIVSDLLQNSPNFSVYKGSRSYRDPAKGDFPERSKHIPNHWDGVTLYELQRTASRHLQTLELEEWWLGRMAGESASEPIIRKF